MKESVYIETSVISYLVARPSRDLVVAARQQITCDWWEKSLRKFDVYVSPYVIGEISLGNPEYAELRLKSISGFQELEITPMVEKLADKYFKTLNIPEKAKLDCFHLAISAVHGIDYLISWNCNHIVNARVKRTLESVNFDLDIRSPMVCTPEELLEDRTDDPIIAEIRDIRMNLEKKLGGSSSKMQRYFRDIQKKHKSRLVCRKTQPALRHAKAG